MTKIYCFANHKGGTGKSTSTLNVGAGIANTKKRVLLIDLDPQTNLSVMLGIYDKPEHTIYEILADDVDINKSIINLNKYLHIIPSCLDLSGIELEISDQAGRENKLKRAISYITNKYDYILIDAPPSMSLLTINALLAANKVFIPVQTEFVALNGLARFVEIIEKIIPLNPKLKIGGIIPTRFDTRKVLNRGVIEKITEIFPDKIMKTITRENIALAESVAVGLDIFQYAPKSNGAIDYQSLVNEIINIKG